MAKGFICYAHADRTMFHEVRKQLAALETAFPITFWDDPSLRGGDLWDEVIKAEVAAADLFLLLFSPDWFSSTYIQRTELPAILRRSENSGAPIVPVILRDCRWKARYGKFQAIPTNEAGACIPVANWKRYHDGYARVGEQVEEFLLDRMHLAPTPLAPPENIRTLPQDRSGPVWLKQDAVFAIVRSGDISDDQAAQDPAIRQLHARLRDRATDVAALLTTRAADPDADDQLRITAERARAVEAALATPTEAVPAAIGDLYDAIQMLAIGRDGVRHSRNQRPNRPDPLTAAEFAELDGLATQATLWIRQFPRAQKLDAEAVSPGDLPRLAPLAGTIINAARDARLIADADAERILALLADPEQAGDAVTAARSRAVLGTRNLLYRLGTFALGFVPDPILPGAWDDRRLTKAVEGLLVNQAEALTSFMVGLPAEVREAFGHLIAVTQEHGLRLAAPPPEPAPPPPANPPSDFSLDEVKRRVLAGEAIPAVWVPFVTRLDLSDTNLQGLVPVATLTALRTLYISNTEISDLTPLAGLTALQDLYLGSTKVRDLTPIGLINTLQSLSLRNTRVGDLTPLRPLTALQSLNLRDTSVSDVTPLGALTALQSLDLTGTQVSDVSPLGALTALQFLDLNNTPVIDVTPLAALTALQSLDLNRTSVSDVTPLTALTALQSLDFWGTPVSDVTPLASLTALQSLDLAATPVSDVTPLASLIDLQSLDLMNTKVSDVTPLAALTALQSLDLTNTQVSDVTPLGALTALQSLNLMGTKVSDVTPLASLQALKKLDLTGTHPAGVEALRRPGLEIIS